MNQAAKREIELADLRRRIQRAPRPRLATRSETLVALLKKLAAHTAL